MFFSKSTNRWAILQKHAESAKGIHVKKLSDTRWSSRQAATDCVVKHLPEIVEALMHRKNRAITQPPTIFVVSPANYKLLNM